MGSVLAPMWESFLLNPFAKLNRELHVSGYMPCSVAVSDLQEIWRAQVVIWTCVVSCEHVKF